MTNKTPSPWSADFYRTNTVKNLDDTIEHGGPGSGRYPKGSGKDKIARKEARNIRKNSRKIRKNWRKAYRGNDVRQAKKTAKAMRNAGLIKRKAAKAMIKKAKVDAAQLARLKPQIRELKKISKTSKTSLAEAKKMYNDPAIKTMETLYLKKPKPIEITQATPDRPSDVLSIYADMSDDQKAVTMFLASMVADLEDVDADQVAVEHAAADGELGRVYDTMTEEQQAVAVYITSLMLAIQNDEEEDA